MICCCSHSLQLTRSSKHQYKQAYSLHHNTTKTSQGLLSFIMSRKRNLAQDTHYATAPPALRRVLADVSTNVTTSRPTTAKYLLNRPVARPVAAHITLGTIKCSVIRTLLPHETKLPQKRNIYLYRDDSYEEVMAKVDQIKPRLIPKDTRHWYFESMASYVTSSGGNITSKPTEFNDATCWRYALFELRTESRHELSSGFLNPSPIALTLEWRLVPKYDYTRPRVQVHDLANLRRKTAWYEPRVAVGKDHPDFDQQLDTVYPATVNLSFNLQIRHRCFLCDLPRNRACWKDPATGKHRALHTIDLICWAEAMVAGDADPWHPPACIYETLRSERGSYQEKGILEMSCSSGSSEAETDEEP